MAGRDGRLAKRGLSASGALVLLPLRLLRVSSSVEYSDPHPDEDPDSSSLPSSSSHSSSSGADFLGGDGGRP